MASPFRVFRKYQKTLLVFAGVILMFVFVIGDALVGYLGGSRGGQGDGLREARAMAVRWDGDSLTNAEVENLVVRRHITNAFLEQVEGVGAQAAYMAGVEPRNLRVQSLRGPQTQQQGVESSVVQTKLFADAAREAGMHVSDEAVIQYLDELGRGNVSRDNMREMLERIQSGGWRVSVDFMIDALREEMLARNYMMSHLYAFQTVTPEQRWKDWLSVNDRVVIEAAVIPVESSMIDVPEPSQAELVEFFDEYKERESQPELVGGVELPSSTPGFRIPRKIDLQFIEANFDEFMTKVEDEITDEEIAKYYEDNKELFVKADTGFIDDASQTDGAPTTDAAPPDESTTDQPGDAEPAAATDRSSDADTATESDSATQETSESATDAGEPADSQPAAPADTEPPADDPGKQSPPAEDDQSSRDGATGNRVFRQVAFLQESAGGLAPFAESSEQNVPVPLSADAAATTESTTETSDATQEPSDATEKPSTQSDPSATRDATAEPSQPPASTVTEPAASQPPAEKPKEYQPLEEVRDLIRRDLAQSRVHEQLSKQIDELAGELNAEFNSYLVLDTQAKEGDAPPPPAALADVRPLAEKYGLSHAKTGPMPWLELRHTPVGKSAEPEAEIQLSTSLFRTKDLELYQPIATIDVYNNRYITMKTSDTPGRVPKLDDVRDEVIRAWKLQKADDLALREAEQQVKKAQESGSSLTDFFADKQSIQVIRTDPFSQLTRGEAPDQYGRQRFRISQPDEIVAPGPEFLRRVFELKDGEVGAVLNHDRSIAYVVRVVEHLNSPDELRNAYLAEANTWDGLFVMMSERAQLAQQLLANDIAEGAGMKWERPYDQPEQSEED